MYHLPLVYKGQWCRVTFRLAITVVTNTILSLSFQKKIQYGRFIRIRHSHELHVRCLFFYQQQGTTLDANPPMNVTGEQSAVLLADPEHLLIPHQTFSTNYLITVDSVEVYPELLLDELHQKKSAVSALIWKCSEFLSKKGTALLCNDARDLA